MVSSLEGKMSPMKDKTTPKKGVEKKKEISGTEKKTNPSQSKLKKVNPSSSKSNPIVKSAEKSAKPVIDATKVRPPPRTFSVADKDDDLFKPDSQESKSGESDNFPERKAGHVYDRFLLFDFSGTVGKKGYNPLKEVS